MEDRRKFERVQIPDWAKVYAADAAGRKLGEIRMLGRGGMLVEVPGGLTAGGKHTMFIVDESEGIHREVRTVVRYSMPGGVGCEFIDLEPDAAVEVGVIIGKYYAANRALN